MSKQTKQMTAAIVISIPIIFAVFSALLWVGRQIRSEQRKKYENLVDSIVYEVRHYKQVD